MQTAALTSLFRWSAFAGALALLTGFVTMGEGQLSPRQLPEHVKSPILALELIRAPELLDQILQPEITASVVTAAQRDDRAQLKRAVDVDFGFIVAYAAFFALSGLLLIGLWPSVPIGVLVILFGVVAAVFDVLENRAMLDVLTTGHGAPRPVSLWKWRLLFAASLMAVPMLIDRETPLFRRTLGYVGAILGVIACMQGLFAIYEQNDRLIEAAAGSLNGMFILAVIFLATRRVLEKGLLPALDHLATWPVLAWLKDWPSKDDDPGLH